MTQSWQSENCTANNCISLSVHVFCCYLWRPAKIKDADCCCWQQSLTSVDSQHRKTDTKVTNEWANLCTDPSSSVSINSIWHHVDRWRDGSKLLLSIQNSTPYQLDNWMVSGDWWLVVCTLHKICKNMIHNLVWWLWQLCESWDISAFYYFSFSTSWTLANQAHE